MVKQLQKRLPVVHQKFSCRSTEVHTVVYHLHIKPWQSEDLKKEWANCIYQHYKGQYIRFGDLTNRNIFPKRKK